LFSVFDTKSCYFALDGLEFEVLLPPSPKLLGLQTFTTTPSRKQVLMDAKEFKS
jgi:hypothetical protein